MTPTYLPTWMRDLAAWFNNPNVYMYGRWDQPASKMEGGVDLTSPGGTPVYALESGYLQGAGNFWHSANLYTPGSGNPGYGVVTIRENVPGYGLQDQYYQHINLNPALPTCYAGNCNGDFIQKGTLLGWVNPAIGEVETGFNADWGGVWGVNHPGAWATDPRPMLAALLGEPAPAGNPGIVGGSTTTTTTTTAQPEQSFQKVVLILLALGLVLGGIFFLFHKQIGQVVKSTAKAAVMA